MLKPLGDRDFAVLWAGMFVSLIGDGFFVVALAWEVYRLSNSPAALGTVLLLASAAMVVTLPLAGAVGDRLDRRWILVWSSAGSALATAAMAILTLTHTSTLWEMAALATVSAASQSFFFPVFNAYVPDLVPANLISRANALDQFARPLAQLLIGPALSGLVVAAAGSGWAFLIDAVSFAFVGAMLLAVRARPRHAREDSSMLADIREGVRFARSHVWLWGTLLAAAVSLLFFVGPWEVLVPYLIKNELHGGPAWIGLTFAAGGVGSIVTAVIIGQTGFPSRHITFMYAGFAAGVLGVAGFGLASSLWQLLVIGFFISLCFPAGLIVWQTMLQVLVPPAMRSRVSSLDWTMSLGLVPISYAMTGPAASLLGARRTLILGGLVGGLLLGAGLFLPGMRATERDGSLREAMHQGTSDHSA